MDNLQKDYYKYYMKGAFSGMFGILLSHPVDTIKTHIQMNTLSTIKPTISNLYKGLRSPLIGVGIEKAIVFGTYNYCMNKLQVKTNTQINLIIKQQSQIDYINYRNNRTNIAFSGAVAGLSASLVVTPYERLKILKQMSESVKLVDLNMRFLFKGLSATFTREVPGFAIYFSVYEYFKAESKVINNRNITYLESFIFGGLSGITAWIFIYPQDRIKTILQSNINNTGNTGNISNLNFRNVMLDIYNKGGLTHFYKGFTWAVMRATLLHSGTFCMMELLTTILA